MADYKVNNKFNDAFKQTALGISIGENNQLAEFSRLLRTGAQMAEVDLASLYGYTGQGMSAARFGKSEREAMGNLAKTSGADLSVHAPWSINFSGINPDPRSGERDPEYQSLMKNEMKAAINFADDVSKAMGRQNMPLIFHAASDHFGTPDPKARIVAYDNDANKVLPIGPLRMSHMSEEEFQKIYGEDTLKRVRAKGIKTEGNNLILSPEGNFEFQKDQMRMKMNQERASLEVNRANLKSRKNDIALELVEASTERDLKKIDELTKKKNSYEDMLKDLDSNELRLDSELKHLDTRFSRFEDMAPLLAAEGIKDAAMLSAASRTKPMILVENTMTPDMSLSKPQDVAETVARARELFVQEQRKKGMSDSSARRLSEELIGVNLDIGHLNIFKSYGMKDSDITAMLREGKTVKDESGNTVFMPDIAQLIKRYHLNDNMGDIDAHLPLGEGTVPIKEIFETLRNAGVEAPAIMEVFGGTGGIEPGMAQSLQYLGAPLFGDMPYLGLPAYAANPYSSLIGDYSSYSNLGLRHDLLSYGGFSGLSPILGGGYMDNTKGGGGGFSGAPMV